LNEKDLAKISKPVHIPIIVRVIIGAVVVWTYLFFHGFYVLD